MHTPGNFSKILLKLLSDRNFSNFFLVGSVGPARRMDPETMSTGTADQTGSNPGTTTGYIENTTTYLTDDPVVGTTDEVTVLDPDHPLMQRFQNALRVQLIKQKEELELKQRELNTEIKRHQSDRESLGVNLYELQQELGRQQANLEDEHDKLAKERQHRRIIENELEG